jgi:hypothetical protein
MARGWESKSVELQQDEFAGVKRDSAAQASAEKNERQRKLDCLELSRTRILHDLQSACNPRYRSQLEAALSHVNGELAKLQ